MRDGVVVKGKLVNERDGSKGKHSKEIKIIIANKFLLSPY